MGVKEPNNILLRTRQMFAGSDELGDWVAGMSIVACGVRVGVRTNRKHLLSVLLELIPSIWKPSSTTSVERLFSLKLVTGSTSNGRLTYRLYEDGQVVADSEYLDSVVQTFERQLKMYLAEMARRRVFVHAGAVGWKGKAIIVPGRSLSGKTSLVAELLRAGATYYSDEYAVLDRRGRVHPYPAPLAIRESGSYKQKKFSVNEFGKGPGLRPLPLGLVVVSEYKRGEHWRPRQLTAGEGMLELLANTIPARRKPEEVITTLREAVSDSVILKGARGDASETAGYILDSLRRIHCNFAHVHQLPTS